MVSLPAGAKTDELWVLKVLQTISAVGANLLYKSSKEERDNY